MKENAIICCLEEAGTSIYLHSLVSSAFGYLLFIRAWKYLLHFDPFVIEVVRRRARVLFTVYTL